ncbi:MAG TPA: dUTP diphosphatase [Firmicutes bacterium]|jgi:dUTP pyrophosphatase|nr:dUTP diphosphatase [Bacillota bacterium]
MSLLQVKVKQLAHAADLPLPRYMTAGASGMDLLAAVNEEVSIPTGGVALIPTGLTIALPVGYEAQIRPRSGLAAKYGVTLLNTPGTIDQDYRGEIKALLINHGPNCFKVKRGDRIAQLVIAPVARVELIPSSDLEETARGAGGFGHTGR